MDINKILKQLCSERDDIERAILALEQVGGKRRGPTAVMDAGDRRTHPDETEEETIQGSGKMN